MRNGQARGATVWHGDGGREGLCAEMAGDQDTPWRFGPLTAPRRALSPAGEWCNVSATPMPRNGVQRLESVARGGA
jgi:hypothetical protein